MDDRAGVTAVQGGHRRPLAYEREARGAPATRDGEVADAGPRDDDRVTGVGAVDDRLQVRVGY